MPRTESRLFRWLWRLTIVTACLHVTLFTWAIYRRLWQVQRIEIVGAPASISAGDTVALDVITSGEVQNRIVLELARGEQREALYERRAEVNRLSAYDPRLFRYRPTVRIGAEPLSRLGPGPATLRLTVFGGQKLLQTPKPRVREAPVTIAHR
jgi:hypothetical protein